MPPLRDAALWAGKALGCGIRRRTQVNGEVASEHDGGGRSLLTVSLGGCPRINPNSSNDLRISPPGTKCGIPRKTKNRSAAARRKSLSTFTCFSDRLLALARWCARCSASTTARSLRAVRSWENRPKRTHPGHAPYPNAHTIWRAPTMLRRSRSLRLRRFSSLSGS